MFYRYCYIYHKERPDKGKKGNKQPGTNATIRVPKKVHFEKHCNLCKKHRDAHTMHSTRDCCKYEANGMKKANFGAAKKGTKKPNPTKQSFAQLSKKLDKLEKAIEKQNAKSKKCHRDDSDSDSKKGIGSGSIRKVESNSEELLKRLSLLPLVQLKLPSL